MEKNYDIFSSWDRIAHCLYWDSNGKIIKEKEIKMTKQMIKATCSSCGGTGLYEGFCEKRGHPVICLSCSGTGCSEIWYEPFIERKRKKGVEGVRLSRGTFILSGVGPVGNEVSYDEFLSGKLKYE
jgi:hypothetical protein